MHERIQGALQDMVEHAREASRMSEGLDLEDVLEDRVRRLALERALEIVGEAAARVPDFVRRDIDLDWRRIFGLRNILIHSYDGVDWGKLWSILENDLEPVITHTETFLAENP